MPRIPRVVIPNLPHHVTQRGNRRQNTFFCPGDYRLYLELLAKSCAKFNVEVWAYCLMPNHVHLIMVPRTKEGLHWTLKEVHQAYSRFINIREHWRGHLWQNRFSSFPMDEIHLLNAARYIELNPVRAGICKAPVEYPWSSAIAHLMKTDDGVVLVSPLLQMIPDWDGFLRQPLKNEDLNRIRDHERHGRPLGEENFVSDLERISNRKLRKAKAGRKPLPKEEAFA